MPTWQDYENTLETAIDGFYGENIRLIPMHVVEGYTAGATEDTSRSIVEAVGYPLIKGSMSKAAGAFISKRTEADHIVRVDKKYLTDIREKDRVLFLATRRNNLLCEISFIEPSMSARKTIHLMTVEGGS